MTKKKSVPTSSPDDDLEGIYAALEVLRLPLVRQALDESVGQPQDGKTRLGWLRSMLERQSHTRLENRAERRTKESKLPASKTLEAFDFDFQPTLDRDHMLELATLKFLDQQMNVLFAGWPGTGKSHIAMAIGLNACMANRSVRYTTNADMLKVLNASLADETLDSALQQYIKPELLIIDEVGLEQVEKLAASRSGLMQKVLLPRYFPRRSTIITSNIGWSQWGEYLEDQLGASALLDRLIHHSHVIVIEGPSWRDEEHKKELAASGRGNKAKAKTKPV